MKVRQLILTVAVVAASASAVSTSAFAQAKEQFFPSLVYRTGPFATNGAPMMNGFADYLKLVNKQGGINGVKVVTEECEFAYSTARGVECYERLKGKHGGASALLPWSSAVTIALTDKAYEDKISVITPGFGSTFADGSAYKWNFPLTGTHWASADLQIQYLAKKEGGFDKLKGKKITQLYFDSAYGKEAHAVLEQRAKMHGFVLETIPVTSPGLDQKSAWLQIRRSQPDYVLLWGWGVMNPTALREARATGFPASKIVGLFTSGSEPDVLDVGDAAIGYSAVVLQPAAAAPETKVVKDILAQLHAKGEGTGPKEEVGQTLYMRGVVGALLVVEGARRAQERFGVGKWMSSEQVRWGLENLNLTQAKLDAMGFAGVLRPITTSCNDHMGSSWAKVQTWDGTKWTASADWLKADDQILNPLVHASSEKFLAEKKLTRRSGADCDS